MPATQTIFVYGTLQRGHCRQHCWPRPPHSISPAFVRGRLLDLGAFPGLLEGDDWVRGEAWEIARADLPETLRALDRIEGYRQADEANQYDRVEVALYAEVDGAAIGQGIVYQLADRQLRQQGVPVEPTKGVGGQVYAEWSAPDA